MKHSHTNFWVAIVLSSLVVVSSVSVYASQKFQYYKGLEASPEATMDTVSKKSTMVVPRTIDGILKANEDRMAPYAQASILTAEKIIDPKSCEAKGKTTYRGDDQPGLLYGMCIE